MDVSEKLGSLFFDGLINLSPGMGFLVLLLISPIGLWLVRALIEGRFLRWSDEFRSARCDALLALSFGVGLILVDKMQDTVYVKPSALWNSVQVVIALAWIGFGLHHMYMERREYNWGQRLSPSALYHNGLLFVLFGYLLTWVCGLALIFAPWFSFENLLLRLIMLGGIGAWLYAGAVWDPKHLTLADGTSRYAVAHVDHGWPWQWMRTGRWGYWHLRYWWQRFAATRGL